MYVKLQFSMEWIELEDGGRLQGENPYLFIN